MFRNSYRNMKSTILQSSSDPVIKQSQKFSVIRPLCVSPFSPDYFYNLLNRDNICTFILQLSPIHPVTIKLLYQLIFWSKSSSGSYQTTLDDQ